MGRWKGRSSTHDRTGTLSSNAKAQIAADVALAMFEALQHKDRPDEVLEDEDVHRTMPRRLGLSGVIDRQVRLQRENVKRGNKFTVEEMSEFMKLALRRPDSREIFFDTGARLVAKRSFAARLLPRGLRFFIAKRRILRRLDELFARRLGGFLSGPFNFETSASPFVQVDPTGEACHLLSGFCQQALRDVVDHTLVVTMVACESKGDPSCRWTLATVDAD